MGNCCTNDSVKDKEMNMQRNLSDMNYDKNKKDMALSGMQLNPTQTKDIIKTIVRLQAFVRGSLARNKVKQKYGFRMRSRADIE